MRHELANVAYIAGFFDGEGHVAIERSNPAGRQKSHHYSTRIVIANTDVTVLEWIQTLWGGRVYRQQRQCLRPVYSWAVSSPPVITDFLATHLPHLRVKRSQAELVLDYLANITVKRSYGRWSMPTSELRLREDYRQRLLELRRPQRSSEQPLPDDGEGEATIRPVRKRADAGRNDQRTLPFWEAG